jgi:hypothetical protein
VVVVAPVSLILASSTVSVTVGGFVVSKIVVVAVDEPEQVSFEQLAVTVTVSSTSSNGASSFAAKVADPEEAPTVIVIVAAKV